MFNPGFYDNDDDPIHLLPPSMRHRLAAHSRSIFDEYYRCYPVAMLPGPEREDANHGGKVFMPPSALDKLTRLHITYPMLFELTNGAKERKTHAGVLEFIAEEGKIYLPFWIMQTLLLEPGDLLQIKSTDLPSGSFIKLQPQSTAFLDISDPKAVLENVMRNFSCLTTGDTFSFAYNDQVYEMAVLETKPETSKKAISVLETDLEVDFAPPVGYVEPTRENRVSRTSTPGSVGGRGVPPGGTLHNHGTMAQAINYSSIAPSSTAAVAGSKAVSSNFLTGGHKLSSKKASGRTSTPVPAAAAAEPSSNPTSTPPTRRTNGPQPLRLPPGKLFFGYEIKLLRNKAEAAGENKENEGRGQPRFQGSGQTLRSGTKRKGDGDAAAGGADAKGKSGGQIEGKKTQEDDAASRASGSRSFGGGGRTLRDSK